MSGLLQKMFGGSPNKPPSAQDAIQRLRETEGMLNKKSEYLETKIEEELKMAKKCGTKNKRGTYTVILKYVCPTVELSNEYQRLIVVFLYLPHLFEMTSFHSFSGPSALKEKEAPGETVTELGWTNFYH